MLNRIRQYIQNHRAGLLLTVSLGTAMLAAAPVAVLGAPAHRSAGPLAPLPELNLTQLRDNPLPGSLPPWQVLVRRVAWLAEVPPQQVEEHVRLVWQEATRYGRDPWFDAGLVLLESNFDQHSTSDAGAVGLYQLMPETAAELAEQLHLGSLSVEQLYDPSLNIKLGAFYLNHLYRKYDGDILRVLTAYNYGETGLLEYERAHGNAGSDYALTVLRLRAALRGTSVVHLGPGSGREQVAAVPGPPGVPSLQ